jgi:hypothetical protein
MLSFSTFGEVSRCIHFTFFVGDGIVGIGGFDFAFAGCLEGDVRARLGIVGSSSRETGSGLM